MRLDGRGLQAGEDHLEVGGIHVVGDGEIAVALHLGPAPELRRNQLAVAIQGMSMEVYHKGLFSVFGFRFSVVKVREKLWVSGDGPLAVIGFLSWPIC